MNLLRVSWRNLWHKPFSTAVSVLLMTLGVTMVSLVVHLGKQVENQFIKNLKGIDLVVGAKGSPKQLILSALYHIDSPTGNISKSEADKIMRHPMVKEAIPLAYGDSYKGFKIMGTTTNYLSHFEAELAEGKLFAENLEVVLGFRAAQKLGLKLGSHFHGTHGMEEADEEHKHEGHAYTVVGILAPTDMAIDQLILCNIETVWEIHSTEQAHEQAHEHAEDQDDEHTKEHNDEHEEIEKEYTAVLLAWKGPMAMMTLPRFINEKTAMQAAQPSIEINSLINQMGIGIETMRLLALLIIFISGLTVFFSLLNSLKERKYELAIMRSLGARPFQLVLLVVYEAMLIAIISYGIGLLLSRVLFMYLANYLDNNYHYYFTNLQIIEEEYWLLGLSVLIALFASIIPAIMAFGINISKTLAEE